MSLMIVSAASECFINFDSSAIPRRASFEFETAGFLLRDVDFFVIIDSSADRSKIIF